MKKMFSLCILYIFLCGTLFSINAQEIVSDVVKSKEKSNEFSSPFRYVIVANTTDLEKYVNKFPDNFLTLEVLINDNSFNENNLKILSELLSKRFSNAKVLDVYIYTSLEAIKTPEENDKTDLKGPSDNYFNYKRANFSRNTFGNEWFTYSIPNLINEKIVVLKGCYIKCK